MLFRVAADGVAGLHLAAILFAAFGSFLAWRWRRVLVPHAAIFLAVVGINLAGADCPLTDLEKSLRRRGGERPYPDGYISHYLVHPVHSAGVTHTVSIMIAVTVVGPALLGYLGLLLRWVSHRHSRRLSHAGPARFGGSPTSP
jgi:hypothetical protein